MTPREAIVVQVVAQSALDYLAPDNDPLFDAAAELAAVKLGSHPLEFVVEVAAAIEAATPVSAAPKQQVHMGNAQRIAPATERRLP